MQVFLRQHGRLSAQLKCLLLMALLIVTPLHGWSQRSGRPAISTSIVISQVYGGGGNTNATYKNDFVELYNRGNTIVDLSGWTVQYAGSSGTFAIGTNSIALNGSIAPGRYYLIQLASNSAAVGADLPTPDYPNGTINMAAAAGKVALANNASAVTGPTAANVVDFVGYGSANEQEGSQSTSAPSATASISRNSNGCTDTDNNRPDFTVGTVNPRNSSSPTNYCNTALTTSPTSLTNFVATTTTDSDEQSYTVTGTGLNSAVTVTAPTGYVVALTSGGPYTASATTGAPVDGRLSVTVYVVLRSTSTGSISGTITNTNGSASVAVSVSGTVSGTTSSAQTVQWDGEAGTNYWFDAANWSTNAVPATDADVVLDHAFVTSNYKVLLQSATTTAATVEPSVSILSLTINPNGGEPISIEIPALNTNGNALTLNRSGANEVALAIYNKGTVTNSAGPNSNSTGPGLTVAGSGPTVYIYNGGIYQHFTNRAHATVVENLAPANGTENGRWEFRASNNTSSSTLSLSKRSYPTLVLRANLNTSTTSYTGSGTALTIRGNLIVEPSVTFSPNVTGDLKIAGNLEIAGALRLAPTSTGSPTTGQLVLNGLLPQTISGTAFGTAGGTESYLSPGVTVQINNPSGVLLATSVLVNGTLQLTTGPVVTSTANKLTLAAGATISGGSATSFINGPLACVASGPTTLRFALGKVGAQGNIYRPLTLTIDTLKTTTTFTATQVEGRSTGSLSSNLTRVSQVRYFEITPTPVLTTGNFVGTVTLSYGSDDKISSPESSSLVIAKNDNNVWANIGRSSYAGTAGSGTVTSGKFRTFSWFSFASTSTEATVNPLPVELASFSVQRSPKGALLRWATATEKNNLRFEVWRSIDGQSFAKIGSQPGHGNTTQTQAYHYLDATLGAGATYYRLRQVDADSTVAETHTQCVAAGASGVALPSCHPNPVVGPLTLQIGAPADFRLLNEMGQVAYAGHAPMGTSTHQLSSLPTGLYLLEIQLPGQPLFRQKLLKLN